MKIYHILQRKFIIFFIISILSIISIHRNVVWFNNKFLWSDVVAKSPNKARGHNDIGVAYDNEKRFDIAVREYTIAIHIDTTIARPYNNLGLIYTKTGMFDEAIQEFIKAIEIKPTFATAFHNLGLAYKKKD